MYKRILQLFSVFAVSLILSAGIYSAKEAAVIHAGEEPAGPIYIEPDMYTAKNQYGPRVSTFDLNATPWLYLIEEKPGNNSTSFLWQNTTNNDIYNFTKNANGATWYNFNDFNWGTIKAKGDWNITATYTKSGDTYTQNHSFTVTPEPISSILFLLGGAGLALRQYKKRKNNSI